MIQEVLSKLQELQEILAQKYSLENELTEIPKALNTKKELVNRLNQSYIDKTERLQSGQKTIGELRIKMSDAEREREKYEEQMGNISTQREYEALIKEIRLASEKEQNLRKDLQREEKYIEELGQNIENEELLIQEQTKEIEDEQRKIKEETEKRLQGLKKLIRKEETITPGMDEEMIFKFKRIIRSKGGRGIVPLSQSVCSGCNMILPVQFVNEVRAETEVKFCPYCSMILYHYPESDEAKLIFDDSMLEDEDDFDDGFDDDFDDEKTEEEEDFAEEDPEEGTADDDPGDDDNEDEHDDTELDEEVTEQSLEDVEEDDLDDELDEE